MFTVFVACGGWVYWNTQIRNSYKTKSQTELIQANYEKDFKSLAGLPQPRVIDVRFEIDLFPERRSFVLKGRQSIENQEAVPIKTIILHTTRPYTTTVEIDGATQESFDEDSGLITLAVSPPMEPGEIREMNFTVEYQSVGFENSLQVKEVVQNGTFFNSFIVPQIGYQPAWQLSDEKKRKRHGLDKSVFTNLDPMNMSARRNSYLSNNSDWVNLETVISTSADQIAVAPGSLIRTWNKDGRRYFYYKLDHPSVNLFSFASARYKVALRQWNDVDVEVYYHPDHERNVDLMLRSMRKSLQYYSEAFGPYKHKQARIVEFPRVSMFAQAFPGTMPYSEGVGFIADLQDPNDVDMVFYVVAHEVAHQWWAHQVVGANMRGATVLSETLAQYSALMVMEKEYGRDMMRKFLRYEMDNYLRARGQVGNKETPLKDVEFQHGFVHYNKGSVAMYHLKETIGEANLNAALRSVVDKFAYGKPPYPTSVDLIEAIRAHTPPEHHGLLVDLFDNITLFANRTIAAKVTETTDGKFDVEIQVEFEKLQSDEDGNETEIPIDDWIEIGAFAKPESGSNFGETLHREKVHVTQNAMTFNFTTDRKPNLAGVDPFNLLIDRNSGDNMKTPVSN
jgi:aminopeptidase N